MAAIPETSFSLAEKMGFIALMSAFLLFFVSPFLAVIPLSFYLLLCFIAPFFPKFGFYLPVISRGETSVATIALTFDDGPEPSSTPLLLELLARHNLQATFFVVGEKVARYPELIADIIGQGHTIGNHSWSHDYFLMLRSQKRLQEDLHNSQEILKKMGIQPLVFRPPVGIIGPRLRAALAREGLITVTYSCRALDRGNRNVANLSEKIFRKLHPGAIIMLHDLPPYQKNQSAYWQQELDTLFAGLKKNYEIVPLDQIIKSPVHLNTRCDTNSQISLQS